MNYRVLTAIFVLIGPFWAEASDEPCNIRRDPNQQQYSDLIQAATIVGEENRETEEQYAKTSQNPIEKVQQAFGATGILNCGGFELTAQVSGKANVLTTAGHMFFDDNCNPKPAVDVSQCFFRKSGNADEKLYYLDAASLKTGKCVVGGNMGDWATVKMTENVEGVEPYHVPSGPVRPKVGETILTVSGYAMNFNDANQSSSNLNVCSIKEVLPDRNTPLRTDCDTGYGASGSAQFLLGPSGISLEPEKLILSAINVAQSKTHVDGAEYGPDQYNISVPVSGKFLDAIKANMR